MIRDFRSMSPMLSVALCLLAGAVSAGDSPGAPSAEAPRFECVPGYQVCSLYVNAVEAESEAEVDAALRWREAAVGAGAGAGEDAWRSALAPVYVPWEKSLRGSLLDLREDTEYELELEFTDRGKRERLSHTFRTRTSAAPVAETIVLDENTPLPLRIARSGKPGAYLRYTLKPGAILDGGDKSEHAILLDKVSYVILDSLTLRGGRRYGVFARDCVEIRIVNCDISGFGRIGEYRPDKDGQYYDGERHVNMDAGIALRGCRGVLIERNYIHDPRNTANSWFYSHPAGPNAVNAEATREAAIRYNDFVGGDSHRWNDAFEGLGNGRPNGSLWRDAEVTGNNFLFGNDDGMELDGGQVNARFFGNKSEGFFCGVSAAPCLAGPSYYYRNLMCSTGAEFGMAGSAFKNIFRGRGRGRVHIFNNTVVGLGAAVSCFGGGAEPEDPDSLRLVTRKNILAVSEVLFSTTLAKKYRVDLDYDLLRTANPGLRGLKGFQKEFGQEKNGIDAEPMFVDASAGRYALRPPSPGFAEGVGAFANGEDEELPSRPIPIVVSAARLNFRAAAPEEWQSQTVTLSATKEGYSTPLRIRKNDEFDFLEITPAVGVLRHGLPLVLTVSIKPEGIREAKRYSAAFLVRLPDGFSRVVTVYADASEDGAMLAREREAAIRPSRFEKLEDNRWLARFDLAEDTHAHLFGRFTPDTSPYIAFSHNGGESSRRQLRGAVERRSGPVWKNVAGPERDANPRWFLPAGRHEFILAPETGQALDAALARRPEVFLNSPWR